MTYFKNNTISSSAKGLCVFFLKLGYKWKRIRLFLTEKCNQAQFEIQQKEIEVLKRLEDSGYIDLYFGDESYFGLTPRVPYAWQTKKNSILLPAAKRKYLNVIGLMNRNNDLFFEMLETTLDTDKFILFIDRFVEQLRQKTIVVLDNCSIHKSKKFKAKIEEWNELDLWIYFLPPYSPELNLIEILWRRIKYQWLPFNAYLCFQGLKEQLLSVSN